MTATIYIFTRDGQIQEKKVGGEWPISSLKVIMDNIYLSLYQNEIKSVLIERNDQ